jgi:hypothetical protein
VSNWTHVAAIFRVDQLILPGMEKLDVEEVFGKVIPDYEWSLDEGVRETEEYKAAEKANQDAWDEYEEHPELFVPTGSEGSLQMSVWENPDSHCLAALTVSVFGDLRDHDSIEDVVEWFRRCCEKAWIRQAIIDIENEQCGNKQVVYRSGDDDD